MYLSIVTSLYNEESNVKMFLKELVETSDSYRRDYEIVAVDNGSTDRTGNILEAQKNIYGNLRVIHSPVPNLGKGNGLRIGINKAKGKYIALIDGDLEQHPKDLFLLLDSMERKGLDYILGWRRTRESDLNRLVLSKAYNIIVKILFRLPVWDVGGQPRIFKSEYLDGIEIHCKRWLIEVEIPFLMKSRGLKGGYMRVNHRSRYGGKSKINIKQAFSILLDLIKFRLGVYSNV